MQKLLTLFQTKNIGVFQILTFEILTNRFLMISFILNNWAERGEHQGNKPSNVMSTNKMQSSKVEV